MVFFCCRNYILKDTPKVKKVIKIEMQMKNGEEDITKQRKKTETQDRNIKGCYR